MSRNQDDTMTTVPPPVHHWNIAGEFAAAGSIAGAVLGALPTVATLLGIGWYSLMIWESPTFQSWLDRRRMRRPKPDKPEDTPR